MIDNLETCGILHFLYVTYATVSIIKSNTITGRCHTFACEYSPRVWDNPCKKGNSLSKYN